jgi:hypothetical protein
VAAIARPVPEVEQKVQLQELQSLVLSSLGGLRPKPMPKPDAKLTTPKTGLSDRASKPMRIPLWGASNPLESLPGENKDQLQLLDVELLTLSPDDLANSTSALFLYDLVVSNKRVTFVYQQESQVDKSKRDKKELAIMWRGTEAKRDLSLSVFLIRQAFVVWATKGTTLREVLLPPSSSMALRIQPMQISNNNDPSEWTRWVLNVLNVWVGGFIRLVYMHKWDTKAVRYALMDPEWCAWFRAYPFVRLDNVTVEREPGVHYDTNWSR